MEIKLVEVTDPEAPFSKQAISLYQVSFPKEEQTPVEQLINGIRLRAQGNLPLDHRTHFWASVQEERVTGISIYSYVKNARLGFLYYLATQPELRGKGLGGWLFKKTAELCQEDALSLGGKSALGLVWEVERPDHGKNYEEQTLRQRRIIFYQRNGAILLEDIDLVAPPLSEGLPPVSYYLMFLPTPGSSPVIDQGLKMSILDVILIHGYGLEPDSVYYQKAMKSFK